MLELAERLWPGSEGWFEGREFCIAAAGTLDGLVQAITSAELVQLDTKDDTGSPILIGAPFRPLRLDWWQDESHSDRKLNGKELKVWAGTMESVRIASAMQHAMKDKRFRSPNLFEVGLIAYDPENPEKKVEPYYFDARRGPNAHSRDVGFSPNDLGMTTTAFPAVELLCLFGLQVARAAPTSAFRIYDYFTWSTALPTNLLLAASTGQLEIPGQRGYRFENWYRTGQKKHKAFRSAIPLNQRGD
jgi:CRISPR-associated protein Csb3